MAIRSLLKKARARLKEMLRPLLEDKEMRGDDFSHLRVTESGCLYIDEQSDAYKQIITRPRKHHSLHGVEPHLRQTAPRVDSLGRIILPLSIREKLGPGWAVECEQLESGGYVITVRRTDFASLP